MRPYTQFGNPILRKQAQKVAIAEIKSQEIKDIITQLRDKLLSTDKAGVAVAAPQLGWSKQITVVEVRPTDSRPNRKPASLTLINPVITAASKDTEDMWEGCLSLCEGGVFAQVPRHTRVKVKYLDAKAKSHHAWFDGLLAHILQHEIDHLHGILFVDKVKDTRTYMSVDEYIKREVNKK